MGVKYRCLPKLTEGFSKFVFISFFMTEVILCPEHIVEVSHLQVCKKKENKSVSICKVIYLLIFCHFFILF